MAGKRIPKIHRARRGGGDASPTQIWLAGELRAKINLVSGDQNCSMGDVIVFALNELFERHFPWVLQMPKPPVEEVKLDEPATQSA